MGKYKQISITKELYEKLQTLKRDDESFSDLISRLLKQATPKTSTKIKTVTTFTKGELKAMRTLLELAKHNKVPYEKLVEQLEYFITREEKAIEKGDNHGSIKS